MIIYLVEEFAVVVVCIGAKKKFLSFDHLPAFGVLWHLLPKKCVIKILPGL